MAQTSSTATHLFGRETPVTPTWRAEGDEAADFKAIVDNLTSAVYKEWPNDAGVSSLPASRRGHSRAATTDIMIAV